MPGRPKVSFDKSPYLGNFIEVQLKGDSITHVHRGAIPAAVLSDKRMRKFPGSTLSTKQILDMQDLDIDTAHVVIHFFYSKQYECIKPKDVSYNVSKAYQLKVALQVIDAAEVMRLSTLKALATAELLPLAKELDLTTLIAFLETLELKHWFHPELREYIQSQLDEITANPFGKSASEVPEPRVSPCYTAILLTRLIAQAKLNHASKSKDKLKPEDEQPKVAKAETEGQSHFENIRQRNWEQKPLTTFDEVVNEVVYHSEPSTLETRGQRFYDPWEQLGLRSYGTRKDAIDSTEAIGSATPQLLTTSRPSHCNSQPKEGNGAKYVFGVDPPAFQAFYGKWNPTTKKDPASVMTKASGK
ncbi:hypothetical protein IL306_005462 [Fusarium sp. DS 682]|nr:hypothetical protein IL306_005462 [Fusarium sp. DS 682]